MCCNLRILTAFSLEKSKLSLFYFTDSSFAYTHTHKGQINLNDFALLYLHNKARQPCASGTLYSRAFKNSKNREKKLV
jgi:hypothetical protein